MSSKGPGSQGGGSRRDSTQGGGSRPGSTHGGGSRPGSTHGGSPTRSHHSQRGSPGKAQPGYPAPLGYDPGRDPTQQAKERMNPRIDLPPEAYADGLRHPFARRPHFNKTGQDIAVFVNQFRVTRAKTNDIYQYDVSVTPDMGKLGLVREIIWSSKAQTDRKQAGGYWIMDDRKLAWCNKKIDRPITTRVNLDEERGKGANRQREGSEFYVNIRYSRTVRLDALRQYLEEKMEFDNPVLEAMNFLDHMIRAEPGDTHRVIRRLFFDEDQEPRHLDANIDVLKGFYGSIRLTQSIHEGSSGLGINVDVSNTAFWRVKSLDLLMVHFVAAWDRKFANTDQNRLAHWLTPKKVEDASGNVRYEMTEPFKILRRLTRLKFKVYHRGKTTDEKTYTIKGLCWSSDPNKYGPDGGNAKAVTFTHKQTNEVRSVYNHYHRAYNIILTFWTLPCIESTRGGYFPPEACNLIEMQRYNFKLDPNQTAEMIKFAVTRPAQRRKDIMSAAQKIAWDRDECLQEFGMKVDCQFTRTKAKLLRNPEIQYGGNAKVNPGVTGRWDLRGKKFLVPNSQPLKSWAFAVLENCLDKPSLDSFVKVFTQTYQGHGGRIANPPIVFSMKKADQGELVQHVYTETGNKFHQTPQILFFVLPSKEAWSYERLKKSTDCRYGVVSQMLNVAHVRKAQPQYCSNVCMKVNCKLQGQVCRIPGVGTSSAFFKKPTMMIGVDVAHPSVGVQQSSMAAMSMSMDRDAAVYYANCETNGYRVEIVQPTTMHSMIRPLIQTWMKKMPGCVPEHVFYFRDGVSEGQFSHVMEAEVPEIRRQLKEVCGRDSKITVIIATKRHHIRFFPEKGDKNGNPLPGTLVEREVTHPFHYDFYLCSHVAIQGTARPVHYHVLHDEVKMEPDELQKMIYQQCYQYQRATTPVSLHPAVYYAHIVSGRARSHEDIAAAVRMPDQERRLIGKGPNQGGETTLIQGQQTAPLLPMGGKNARQESRDFIRSTMWFI